MELTGKVAFVTGGSRGIGAAIVMKLAERGAAVSFTYRNSETQAQSLSESIANAGGRSLPIYADSGNATEIEAAVAQAVDAFGPIDILVNNAMDGALAPFSDISVADLDNILDIGLRGCFIATKEVVKNMPDGGRVIMIGSTMGETVLFRGSSIYSMAKGGMAAFSRGLARDLGHRRITSNTILPGPIETEATSQSDDRLKNVMPYLCIRRSGTPAEVAALVSFLCGPDSGFITGSEIKIDGGLTA